MRKYKKERNKLDNDLQKEGLESGLVFSVSANNHHDGAKQGKTQTCNN